MYDVAIVGGGLSGIATAMLLQSYGHSSIIIEAHNRLGGCAGFYLRDGFSFDVGATTLVDFHEDGLGGKFLKSVGVEPLEGEFLPGYLAWLPNKTINVSKEASIWRTERLTKLGNTKNHQNFWNLLDVLAKVYWKATRSGISMPMNSTKVILKNYKALDFSGFRYARYLNWTVGDALKKYSLLNEKELIGLLSMMVEDTVHAKLHTAPLINAALGISIRGAGLARPLGGMRGFWRKLTKRYIELGGKIKLRTKVNKISGKLGDFSIETGLKQIQASQIVCAMPIQITQTIARDCIGAKLNKYYERDKKSQGGGLVMCLGVPDKEIESNDFYHRHHQLLQSYDRPLGNGNNMFISISRKNDLLSAPSGYRSVMVSTHCELSDWNKLSKNQYYKKKSVARDMLLLFARRVYPKLGTNAHVCELGTPRSYEYYTGRPKGAIGGSRLNMKNSNQNSVPYNLGKPGFWMVGDTTWPGLGTVACILGATHVAESANNLCNK